MYFTDFNGADVARFWEISWYVPFGIVLIHDWVDSTL